MELVICLGTTPDYLIFMSVYVATKGLYVKTLTSFIIRISVQVTLHSYLSVAGAIMIHNSGVSLHLLPLLHITMYTQ